MIKYTCIGFYDYLKNLNYLWDTISYKEKNLSTDFIRKFSNKLNWHGFSMHTNITEDFIREFQDKVDWVYIAMNNYLSELFIREVQDKIDWDAISCSQQLSENFIREFKEKVNWDYISHWQNLSEDFIREFQGKLNWSVISINQRLNESFIREFQNKVDWWNISKYQKLSNDFINEFSDKINNDLIADSWHYKDTAFKKQQVIDTGLYECHDDYFIAYKGIRSNRYSNFNLHYQYLPGGVYETWCDCSNNENGFGFSAWTEKGASDYCNGLVIKVKIRYEDVGRVVYNDGKIRCFKLEVLD